MIRQGYNGMPQRVLAVIVLMLGILGGIEETVRAGATSNAAVAVLLGLTGFGLLLAIANLVEKPAAVSPPGASNGHASQSLELAVKDLAHALDRSADEQSSVHNASPASPQPPAIDPQDIQRAIHLLEEIRDASLMSESQRQARLVHHAQQRKAAYLAAIDQHIRREEWSQADQLLSVLAQDFPNDATINTARTTLENGRAHAESEAFERVRSGVEDMMAVGSWDQAHETIESFCSNYPAHQAASQLLSRVSHERNVWQESTVKRLYDQTKHFIERREWRNALGSAQKLLERFADHPKTQKIRQQVRTIQNNAEIEERQDQEAHIQRLIKSKRFDEAIELAEDLIRRFPLSPQAEAIEEMLPKLRELAVKSEADRLER